MLGIRNGRPSGRVARLGERKRFADLLLCFTRVLIFVISVLLDWIDCSGKLYAVLRVRRVRHQGADAENP